MKWIKMFLILLITAVVLALFGQYFIKNEYVFILYCGFVGLVGYNLTGYLFKKFKNKK